MFYQVEYPESQPGETRISAMVVLNPAESRRLIAKATVATPEVRNALSNGTVIVARGITNAYVTEELLGIEIEPKAGQTCGLVCNGITNAHVGPPPFSSQVFAKGKVLENADWTVEIKNFGQNDVFIKGANAVDANGNAGIFCCSAKGGSIGVAWPIVTSRSAHLIVPVGLEKMTISVVQAAKHSGIYQFKYSTGMPVKVIPVIESKVITEIQAFGILTGVRAYHLGSGGVGGSEGAVVLALEGDTGRVEKALDLTQSVKGEHPVTLPDAFCVSSAEGYDYDALAQLSTFGGV